VTTAGSAAEAAAGAAPFTAVSRPSTEPVTASDIPARPVTPGAAALPAPIREVIGKPASAADGQLAPAGRATATPPAATGALEVTPPPGAAATSRLLAASRDLATGAAAGRSETRAAGLPRPRIRAARPTGPPASWSTGAPSLRLEVLPQPDDTTCGPTCLHAVYRYFDDDIELARVIAEVPPLPEGGTFAVWLACHALRRGYRATIYTYNLQVFDPTWFAETTDIPARLAAQRRFKRDRRLAFYTEAYLEFFRLGGKLIFRDLSPSLIRRLLKRGTPILTGLSATYLYACSREYNDQYDDVRGVPQGHFVVLCGYDPQRREVMVADPLHDNPGYGSPYYRVAISRLITAILLGIVTYDANLLVITPERPQPPQTRTP
jgi:hypothetical protein